MKKLRWLIVPIAAIGYRLRGSAGKGGWVERIFGFAVGTFLGRFFWCVPVTAMAATKWIMVPVLLAASYVGVMFGYFGGRFDLSQPFNQNWRNYAWLTIRGMVIALPLCIALTFAQKWGFYAGGAGWGGVIGGMAFVPAYKAGLWISPRLKLPTLHGASEWGEILVALAILIGFASTL